MQLLLCEKLQGATALSPSLTPWTLLFSRGSIRCHFVARKKFLTASRLAISDHNALRRQGLRSRNKQPYSHPARARGREMAVQWTVPVQRRAAEVERRCVRACGALADAAERLALPVHVVADAPGVRARLELVRASDDLALAACSMKAVELFAVRGAAANLVTPLASAQHVPGGDHHPVWLALSLFQSARG